MKILSGSTIQPARNTEEKMTSTHFKWPVSAEQTIAATADDVWKVISRPGNLEQCHPFCARNPVSAWPGETSRDKVHYLSGWVYERRFRQWHEGTGYDLDICRGDEHIASVSWRITPVEVQRCKLGITVYPNALQSVPVAVRWVPHLLRVRPMLTRYLDSVVRGFDWYVTHGQPVPRNQFGRHPWFSAAEP